MYRKRVLPSDLVRARFGSRVKKQWQEHRPIRAFCIKPYFFVRFSCDRFFIP